MPTKPPQTPTAFRQGVGWRLEQARLRAGLCRRDAADAAGVSVRVLQLAEDGRTLTLETLAALCRVYGVGADWVLGGEG